MKVCTICRTEPPHAFGVAPQLYSVSVRYFLYRPSYHDGLRRGSLHYLLNKLKSEDGWSSSNLTWNDEKLAVISEQFSSFDGVLKNPCRS